MHGKHQRDGGKPNEDSCRESAHAKAANVSGKEVSEAMAAIAEMMQKAMSQAMSNGPAGSASSAASDGP